MLIIIFLVCCVCSIISVIASSSDEEPEPKPEPTPTPAPAPAPEEKPEMSFSTSAALTAEREFVVPQVKAGRIPVDCVLGEWYNVGECDPNDGYQMKRRDVLIEGRDGGEVCPLPDSEERENKFYVKANCELGDWYNVGGCNKSTGKQLQRKDVKTAAVCGGSCPGSESNDRKREVNCDVDCEVTDWTSVGSCTKMCGGGNQYYVKTITTQPKNGGAACPSREARTKKEACNTDVCNTAYDGDVSGTAKARDGANGLPTFGWVGCTDGAITGFRVVKSGDNFNYYPKCLKWPGSKTSSQIKKIDILGAGPSVLLLASAGGYDSEGIDCNSRGISKFKYSTSNGLQYHYKCAGTKHHENNCRTYHTAWTHDGAKEDLNHLTKHEIQCPVRNGEEYVLKSFKMNRDNVNNNMNYTYKCCPINIGGKDSDFTEQDAKNELNRLL